MKIGDYFRTKKGVIGKINRVLEEQIQYIDNETRTKNELISNIVNTSKELTVLLQDGDYINGYEVIVLNGIKYVTTAIGLELIGIHWTNKTIKEILTKEQYESVVYKV